MTDITETQFIKEKAREEIQDPKVGKVVNVIEHLAEDDISNFEVDVEVDDGLHEERTISCTFPGSNSAHVPKVGDTVVVEYFDGINSRPMVSRTTYTNEKDEKDEKYIDRAPLARAGMYKDVYESGESPTGPGDLNITGWTQYDGDQADDSPEEMEPVTSWVQIAKTDPTPDPVDSNDAPMVVEMYDSPTSQNDESRIRMKGNQVDGNDKQSMAVDMDFKDGVTTIDTFDSEKPETLEISLDVKNGELIVGGFGGGKNIEMRVDIRNNTAKIAGDGSNEMGMSLDFDTDAFKVLDGGGYGIESDGSGNFTWHHNTIDFKENSTTSL